MTDEVRELLDKLEKTDGAPLIWFNKKLYEYPKEIQRLNNIINKAIEYNEHLLRDAKYHLNDGHLRKMRKILGGEE